MILSIDIGFKNQSFTLTKIKNNYIKSYILCGITINKIEEISEILEKIFKNYKIETVLIEKQYNKSVKNYSLMRFIQGYCLAKKKNVLIKNPISTLNKNNKNRKQKKEFSINLLNLILKKNNFINFFEYKDSDICDSLNICYDYLNKNFFKYDDFTDLKIKKILKIYIKNLY